jgi:hypothetical protein
MSVIKNPVAFLKQEGRVFGSKKSKIIEKLKHQP